MRNFENLDNSHETANNVICDNVLETIVQAGNISKSFNNLRENTGAYVDGYLDVMIGTFMAGDDKMFRLASNDPEKITPVRFHGEKNIFQGSFNQDNPLIAETINITLEKNKAGIYESVITFRNKIDDETEMIVEMSGSDFSNNYSIDFQDK